MSQGKLESSVLASDLAPKVLNKTIVDSLYKALAEGEMGMVAKLLASDLEWWFHGPQYHRMMKVLTGKSNHSEFRFKPRNLEVIGDCVIAEGWEGANVYWVHVWTLKNGLISQFREYFNTFLTVKDTSPHVLEMNHEGYILWQSHLGVLSRSLPGIALSI